MPLRARPAVEHAFEDESFASHVDHTRTLVGSVGLTHSAILACTPRRGVSVTTRFRYILTLPDDTTASARALAYYRLVDSRIAVSDVSFDPDLTQVLGPFLGPSPEA